MHLAVHIGAAELIDPGMAEQKHSFYPDGSSSGLGQAEEAPAAEEEESWEAHAARRSSWASSTRWSGSSNQWAATDWGFARPDARSYDYGRWFWTPQLWVWGNTLEDAVQDGSQKNGRKPNTGKEGLPSHNGKTDNNERV